MRTEADGSIRIPFRLQAVRDELIFSPEELAQLSLIEDAEDRQEFLAEYARNYISATDFEFDLAAA